MIRINVGGLAAQEARRVAAEIGGSRVDVQVVTDLAGVKQVASGKADYYLGACATGGGGALAMAIAILGYPNCFTASAVCQPPNEEEIRAAVAGGKKAFGFTCDHVDTAVRMIVTAILAVHSPDR
ncbi:MAG: DUF2620 domain-containing protein [Chloroflexi bacterium]|nr:DUF2620 domain-containing protein [Chloroflexota bacterium]